MRLEVLFSPLVPSSWFRWHLDRMPTSGLGPGADRLSPSPMVTVLLPCREGAAAECSSLEFRLAGPPRATPADRPGGQARLGAQLPEIEGRQGGRPLFLGMTECLTLCSQGHLAGRLDPARTGLGHAGRAPALQPPEAPEPRARMGATSNKPLLTLITCLPAWAPLAGRRAGRAGAWLSQVRLCLPLASGCPSAAQGLELGARDGGFTLSLWSQDRSPSSKCGSWEDPCPAPSLEAALPGGARWLGGSILPLSPDMLLPPWPKALQRANRGLWHQTVGTGPFLTTVCPCKMGLWELQCHCTILSLV